jgi:hypothetical protein
VKEPNGNGTNGTDRTAKGTFAPGNKLSTGRRKGSRVKLSEAFLSDFHDTWKKHGRKALEKLAVENPDAFVKAAVAVLPRVMQHEATIAIEHTHRSEFDIELTDFAMAYEKFGKIIGADQRLLELQPSVTTGSRSTMTTDIKVGLDAIAGLVFQKRGAKAMQELFLLPEHCLFRDEIVDVADRLEAHGLTDAANAMREIVECFPEFIYGNPHDPDDPNDRANYYWRESHPNPDSQRLEQRAKLREQRGVSNGRAPAV